MRPVVILSVIAVVVGSTSVASHAQSWRPPAENQRCPSKWGAGDERGSGNHMKPETVLRATRLIRTGEVIDIAHVLSASMPFFGTRRFDVHTKRTFMNQPSNRRGSNEEILISEMGQVGTQLDGFAHQTIEDKVYNCFKLDEISTRGGFTKVRFEREEGARLRPLPARTLVVRERRLRRRVALDAMVDVDTVRYSVPHQLVRAHVEVHVGDHAVSIYYGPHLIATHARRWEPHTHVIEATHFHGLWRQPPRELEEPTTPAGSPLAALGRSLHDYAVAVAEVGG